MPLYEYECEACQKRFERIQKFSDPQVDVCPNCGRGPVRKLLSSPAIQFKGSGFYITDYAKKSTSEAGSKSSSGSSESSTSEAKTSDSKPESKTTDSTSKPEK
ncbi:MAG TPA: zinc ribbon domain-containing protein [Vicinamibacterales bacterium]|nr:zinc ribbon domain-containing protein [Vicinamibacterales bacterium]